MRDPPKPNGIEITRSGDWVRHPRRFDYGDKHVVYGVRSLAMPRPMVSRLRPGKATAGGGEVVTHRDEGEFSRIRKGDQV